MTSSDPTHREETLRSVIFLGGGDVISRLLTLAAFLYLARVLGPRSIGLIALGSAAAGFLVPIVEFGLGFIGMREVSRDSSTLRPLVLSILLIRAGLGIVLSAVLFLIAGLLFVDAEKVWIVRLYSLTVFSAVFSLAWAYQASRRSSWFFVDKVSQAVLYALAVFVLIQEQTDYEVVPVAYALSAIIPAVPFLILFLRTSKRTTSPFDGRESVRTLKAGFRLFVPAYISQLLVPLALLMTATLGTLEEAGYFSSASKILALTAAVPVMLWWSFYPAVAAAYTRDTDAQSQLIGQLFKYAALMAVLPLGLGVVHSTDAVAVFFGEAFVPGTIVPFALISLAAALQVLSILFTRMLPSLEYDAAYGRIVGMGLAIQFVVGIAMVPTFGASGAALSLIVTEVFMAWAAIRRLGILSGALWWKIPGQALLLMAVSLAIGNSLASFLDAPLLLSVAAEVAIYFGLLLITGVVSPADFRLRSSFNRGRP